jgi:hypothetical protein
MPAVASRVHRALAQGERPERRPSRREGERGQGIVEFAALVPIFLLLLLGMLEFGFAFDQNLTLQYASREGARVGSALANDGGPTGCTTVDDQIVAAVQRVLVSPGSRVEPAIGMQVLIWKATATGTQAVPTSSYTNTWTYTGPGTGPLVDGQRIAFTKGVSPWSACTRNNGGVGGPDSIGISLTHTYTFQTPLAGILRFLGGSSAGTLTMSDRTIMALNPTD